MSNMTTGQIVGTIVGAVIGYFTGGAGWYLAGSILLGASAGYAAGSALDPVAPDVPGAGQSATGELDVTLADEGIVIADALGTVKGTGNIFWYGGHRVVEIKEKVSGGKGGGSKKVVTGYKYYLSWAMGLCIGPVDELISIFQNNDPVWQGNELRTDSVNGVTTITIDEVGTLYFYFGTDDQLANTDMGALIYSELGQTFNPPYKNLCWVYFKDCSLGSYNRVPTYKFVFRKSPSFAFSPYHRIGGYDYNAAHAIYYLLNSCNEIDSSMIDEDSFSDVAESLILENLGISIYFGEERKTITYIESLVTHINAILQFEADGKFHLTLIRNNVDIDDMESFDESDFVEPISIRRNTWAETNNDIKVQYAKRIDVPFGDEIDPIKSGDVYVLMFIDEVATEMCSEDYDSIGIYTGYFVGSWEAAKDQLTYGAPCSKWNYDVNKYFDNNVVRPKSWLFEGAYHVTSLIRLPTYLGFYVAIAPNGTVPSLYTNFLDENGNLSLWTQLGTWQARFASMVNAGRGEVIPGSVIRIHIDNTYFTTSDFEPAYTLFKAWIEANYDCILILETTNQNEWWIDVLHQDLTGYLDYGKG